MDFKYHFPSLIGPSNLITHLVGGLIVEDFIIGPPKIPLNDFEVNMKAGGGLIEGGPITK